MKALFKIHSDSDLITSLAPIPPPPPPVIVSQTLKPRKASPTTPFYFEHDLAASLSRTTHTTASVHRLRQPDDSNVLYLKQHKHSAAISPSLISKKSYALQTFSSQPILQHPAPKSPIFVDDRLNGVDQPKETMPTFVSSLQSHQGTTTLSVQHKEASSEPELVLKERYKFLQKETYLAPATANATLLSDEDYSFSLVNPVLTKNSLQELPALITTSRTELKSDSNTHLGLLEPISPMSPIILSSDHLFDEQTSEETFEPPAKIFNARPISEDLSLENYLLNIISTVDDTTRSSPGWFPQSPNKNNSQDEFKIMNTPNTELQCAPQKLTPSIQSSIKPTQSFGNISRHQSSNLAAGSRYLRDDISDKSSEWTSSILDHESPNSSLSSYDRSSIGEDKTRIERDVQSSMTSSAHDIQKLHQPPCDEKERAPLSFKYQTNTNRMRSPDTFQDLPVWSLNVSKHKQEGLKIEQNLEFSKLTDNNFEPSDSQPSLDSKKNTLTSWKDTLDHQQLNLDSNLSRHSQVSIVPSLPERSKARELQTGVSFPFEIETRSKFTDHSRVHKSAVQNTSKAKPMRRDTDPCMLNKSLPLIPDRFSITPEPRDQTIDCKSNASSYYEWDTDFSTDDFSFDKWDKIDKDIQLLLNFDFKETGEESRSQLRRAQSEERRKDNGNAFHDLDMNTPELKVPNVGRFAPNSSSSSVDRPHQHGYFSQKTSQERGYQKIITAGGAACYHSSLHNVSHLNEMFSSSDSQLSADTIARSYQDDLSHSKTSMYRPPLSTNERTSIYNSKKPSTTRCNLPAGIHRTPTRSRSVPLLSLEAKMQQAVKEQYLKPVTVLDNGSNPDGQHGSKLRNMHPLNGPADWHKLMSVSSHGDSFKHSQGNSDQHFHKRIAPTSSEASKEHNHIADTAYVSRLEAWKRKLRKPSFNMLRNHT